MDNAFRAAEKQRGLAPLLGLILASWETFVIVSCMDSWTLESNFLLWKLAEAIQKEMDKLIGSKMVRCFTTRRCDECDYIM